MLLAYSTFLITFLPYFKLTICNFFYWQTKTFSFTQSKSTLCKMDFVIYTDNKNQPKYISCQRMHDKYPRAMLICRYINMNIQFGVPLCNPQI